VDNTVGAFDDAVRHLNTGAYFAGLMLQVHPDPKFRDAATDMVRKVSAAQTALALNRSVYDALAGLDLSKADKPTQYYIDRHKPGADGKIHLTTDYPDVYPALKFAKSDALRQRIWQAFETRAYPKNVDVLKNMMQTRYQIATLLGYSSWADYNAADKMIVKGENIGDFIQQVDTAARPIAEREFALLLAEKKKTDPQAKSVADYEDSYFEEQLRRSKYDFDSQAVRPYLPFAEVKQGVLDTAAKLFHISFRQEQNVPAWDPSVE